MSLTTPKRCLYNLRPNVVKIVLSNQLVCVQDMGLLRDYIAYAREQFQPKLSEEASQRLVQCYVDMRKVGSGRGQISAYPRQLESLIRLSEAHAKLHFAQVVTVESVEEAYR